MNNAVGTSGSAHWRTNSDSAFSFLVASINMAVALYSMSIYCHVWCSQMAWALHHHDNSAWKSLGQTESIPERGPPFIADIDETVHLNLKSGGSLHLSSLFDCYYLILSHLKAVRSLQVFRLRT
jgi:hypothetical protein